MFGIFDNIYTILEGRRGSGLASPWLAAVALALTLTLAASAPARANSGARLGSFVAQLAEAYEQGGQNAAAERAASRRLHTRLERGVIWVPVILEPRWGLRAAHIDAARVHALGGRVDAASESFMRVLVPFSRLRRLAEHPDVRVVRAQIAVQELGLGAYESESAELSGARAWQDLGITGAGVDVAVLDLGFIGLSDAISAGELPVDTVIVDLPGSNDDLIEADTVHGVGVAEQVMDMAPDATLHVIKVGDEVDLENATAYLRGVGVEIANHSCSWLNASYYDDTGPINRIINDSAGPRWRLLERGGRE